MSFILDALKKSEQERERQQQPVLLELPVGRRSRAQPLWMWIVIGLLVLNCVLLLVMWWRNGTLPVAAVPSSSAIVSSAASSPAAQPSAPLVSAPPRSADVRSLQNEADFETEPAEDLPTAAVQTTPDLSGPPLVRSTPAQAQTFTPLEASTAFKANPAVTPSAATPDMLPTLENLGGSSALGFANLNLNLHVYANTASERFVFINSKKYSEGQALVEGPLVEKITSDGVILNYRNQRFLLPR
ncbi:MAG: general secretion pathway protein GspB [Steroidobacteraceae bacterium]